MCTTVFKEAKIEAQGWSYNRNLGISDAIADTRAMHDQTYPKLGKNRTSSVVLFNAKKKSLWKAKYWPQSKCLKYDCDKVPELQFWAEKVNFC